MDTLTEALPFRMEPGERFAGKFLVERVLGTGGMGVVVAALHEKLGQTVAIKLLSVPKGLEPEAVARFFREARATAALRSEHIARVIDVGVDELERHYIVMEHLEGEDLGAILARDKSLPLSAAVGYVLHACEAIAEAHSLGIIHRDLKPENLFVTQRKDGAPLLKVLDFGISKTTGATREGEGPAISNNHSLLGTPLYMSPEQVRASTHIDGRSDLWSLGVILYELLTSEQPFRGETIADVIASVLTTTPPSPSMLRPEIPQALSDLVLACLAKEPDDRLPNVGILARDLRPWAPRWARDAAARAARIAGATALSPEETGAFQVHSEAAEGAAPSGPATGDVVAVAPADQSGDLGVPSIVLAPPVAAAPRPMRSGGDRRRWVALLIGAGAAWASVGVLARVTRDRPLPAVPTMRVEASPPVAPSPPEAPTALPVASSETRVAAAPMGGPEPKTSEAAPAVDSPPPSLPAPGPAPPASPPLPSPSLPLASAASVQEGDGPPERARPPAAKGAPGRAHKKLATPVSAVSKTTRVARSPSGSSRKSGIHDDAHSGRTRPESSDPLGSRR